MSFTTVFNAINQFESEYLKVKPWLQFVGYMLNVGGLIGLANAHSHVVHTFALGVAFVGFGVSMAGYLYNKIYP
jgi:hypothetical protein